MRDFYEGVLNLLSCGETRPTLDDCDIPTPFLLLQKNGAYGYFSIFNRMARLKAKSNPETRFNISDTASISNIENYVHDNLLVKSVANRSIDILDVNGIGASKSNLHDYENIFEFGCNQFKIKEVNGRYARGQEPVLLFERLLHDALKSGGNDFSWYEWSNSLKWSNSDGSHRLSMAFYIASVNGFHSTIDASITEYSWNRPFISSMLEKYMVYIFKNNRLGNTSLFDLFKMHHTPHRYIELCTDYVSPLVSERPDRPTLLLIKKDDKPCRKARLWIDKYLGRGMCYFDNTMNCS